MRTRGRQPAALEAYRDREVAADAIWTILVRSTSPLCQRCFLRKGEQAHHLVSREYRPTRWLLDNGAHLCRGCHRKVGVDGEENRLLALRLVGAERWEQLNIAKSCGATIDPSLAFVVLRLEARKRGLAEGKG